MLPLADMASAAAASGDNGPISVAQQGSFTIGGTVLETEGPFVANSLISPTGNTLHGDHAYVQFQVPVNPRPLPLVMWHGNFQFAKTWDTTPDGREGFQTIFVRRGWSVYALDQAGRGRAGNRTASGTWVPQAYALDRSYWIIFRLGVWPAKFPGLQFPPGEVALDQYFRQITPNTADPSDDVEVAPVVNLFDKIGPAVLIIHSQSGLYGWLTRMASDSVKAIVAYEPANYVHPNDDTPQAVTGPDPLVEQYYASPTLVDPAEFQRLTQIPIQIVFGDNIPTAPSPYPGLDMWRVIKFRAEHFVETVNRRGGNASILHLPDHGLLGNTHFPFSDMNSLAVADLLSGYLHAHGLD